MAHHDEYIKYMTQQVITYIETSPDIRKQARAMKKSQKELWLVQWFGMIPLSLVMTVRTFLRNLKIQK